MQSQNLINKAGAQKKSDAWQKKSAQQNSHNMPSHAYDALENSNWLAGDSALAAECATVIQRQGLLHRRNDSRRVQTFLRLQRLYGNQFVQRVIAQHAIQAKLKIGQPGDIYEQEADRLAEQVMKMAEPAVQQQPEEKEEEELIQPKPLAEQITPLVHRQIEEEEKEEEELQMKASPGQAPEVARDLESRINAIKGGGQPLPESVRAFFEPRFGCNFSHVRVHTDSSAAQTAKAVNAKAFTMGSNVAFASGQYDPETSSGKKLLAHELTHVVQQTGGADGKLTLSQPGDRYEQQADHVVRVVMERECRSSRTSHKQLRKQPEAHEPLQMGLRDTYLRPHIHENERNTLQSKASGLRLQLQLKEEDETLQNKVDSRPVRRKQEVEKEELVQPKVDAGLIQRQAGESEKEELEREQKEIAAGIQAKHEGSESRPMLGEYVGERVVMLAKGPLTERQLRSTMDWYSAQTAHYTPNVIREIQEEVGTKPDGIIGPHTVQAITRWQKRNQLFPDGKAGSKTLVAMFGRDIRLGEVSKKEKVEEKAEEGVGLMGYIWGLLRSLGFTDEQSADVVAGKEPMSAPEPVAAKQTPKGTRRKYRLVYAKKFASTLDGVSLKPSLFDKIKQMAIYALDNDFVTGNVVFSSGMRSPKKAHQWSTAYQIRQGNVPPKKLQSLPDGKDLDGTVWYQPGWTMKQVKQNARKKWSGALAAEGYPKGNARREPNTFRGGVTRHATGKAIDATFLWNWSKGESQKKAKEEKVTKLKAAVEKRWVKRPQKKGKVLAAINRFIGRGSYSEIAYKAVEEHGLTRPVLHATSSPEDWHYEEK